MDRRFRSPRRFIGSCARDDGFTLLEVMFALGVAGLLIAIAVPPLLGGLDRSRGLAAARYLASRMALARAQAISRSANVALRFDEGTAGTRFTLIGDGNGNGVRSVDIASGVDPVLEPPAVLSSLFPGAAIAADAVFGPAVQVGSSGLLSFSPDGTATAGSVYVRGADGTQWAVRVLGTTARTRVLRYSAETATWVQAF